MHLNKLTFAALVSAAFAQNATVPDLITALNSTSDLSTLNTLITGLPQETLQQLAALTNITILAPNNAAFEAYGNVSAELIAPVLLYHLVGGAYSTFNETPLFAPTALNAEASGGLTTLTDGQVVELVSVDGANVVYSGLKVNASTVGDPVNFTGGVIHIVDRVLNVPLNVSATAVEFELKFLYSALANTSLVQAVDTAEQVTIFAPNDAAFRNILSILESGNVTNETLTTILQYHVVTDAVLYSTDLTNDTVSTLADGTELNVRVLNGSVYVNNARVVVPDVLVANGVVHVIDEVLNPLNATATANPASGSGTPAFEGATTPTDTTVVPPGVPTPTGTQGGGADSPAATGTTSSSSGAGWHIAAPTGLGAAVLAGVVLAL